MIILDLSLEFGPWNLELGIWNLDLPQKWYPNCTLYLNQEDTTIFEVLKVVSSSENK